MSEIRDFALPDLGEGLEDGEIVRWHVEVGDVIALNDPVVEVETAKAVVDVPCPFAGRVVERHAEEGDTVLVGTVLVRIDVSEAGASSSTGLDADEEPQPLVGYGQAASPPRRRRRPAASPPTGAPVPSTAEPGPAADELGASTAEPGSPVAPPLAKPPVRKLAKDLGVDLASLAPGSGPQGSITRAEVEAAAAEGGPRAGAGAATGAPGVAAPAVAPATAGTPPHLHAVAAGEKPVPGFRGRRPGEVEPIRGIRRRIVEKMERSRREIPSATCSRDADLTELWQLRATLTAQAREAGFDVRITPFALILRATVVALRRYPTLNARITRPVAGDGDGDGDAGEIELLEHIHLGVAADTERGLVVPNIKEAQARSTLGLALELTRLAEAARAGTLTPQELTGGTFTVNNYGAFGNDDGDPIINHPEGAILGVGAIRERPWVVPDADGRGELAIRRVGRFTLAFDHRICDGGEAGRFVTEVATLCEQPSRLLLHL
ncbi:MAG: dihydrolipoamide acetyltransferase family protein [Nitriliruptoraceae bacterium]